MTCCQPLHYKLTEIASCACDQQSLLLTLHQEEGEWTTLEGGFLNDSDVHQITMPASQHPPWRFLKIS